MQTTLINNKITKEKIITLTQYNKIVNNNEYLLFADNILEGIELLNELTFSQNYLSFYAIVYEPMDQPIYIFEDSNKHKYSIKICGAYSKWNLPLSVSKIVNYIDLPDYILYSIKNQKVILAGENTETASVGNSQWQREGRKIAAALEKAPFIYQTFYSGRDESQNTIREPNSLQVYNHLIYSIRYKTPSFVAYFENNFKNSQTRIRSPLDSKNIFSDYIKAILLCDADQNSSNLDIKKALEKEFFVHMINYLKESKYGDLNKKTQKSRLSKDLPYLSKIIFDDLIKNTDKFVNDLIEYIYEKNNIKINKYLQNLKLLSFQFEKFTEWKSYNNKNNIKELISYFINNNKKLTTYTTGNTKIGFGDTKTCENFLTNKFPKYASRISKILKSSTYPITLLMPLRIHKLSNGKLTFSPDPESGEIVAFSEMFSKDFKNKKVMPIIGYCIVDTPSNFDILAKKGDKLYKAIAENIDILIINNSQVYFDLENKYLNEDYMPKNIIYTTPKSTTEEMAIVSTFLNQTTIKSSWQLCFIHTHHSSWQQLALHSSTGIIQDKIDRKSVKVDLILQDKNQFMISEGKDTFMNFLNDKKIASAMKSASQKIDELYKKANIQFDAFIFNLQTNPKKDPLYYVKCEVDKINGAIKNHHFDDIAYHNNFVFIIVYIDSSCATKFKLVYSNNFDKNIKKQLNYEFEQ